MIERRPLLGSALLLLASRTPASLAMGAGARVFRPEMFGAKGDGSTDDSAAFDRLSQAVNAAGGGVVELRKTTYAVGRQQIDANGKIERAKLMDFVGCSRPLIIRGNRARLRCVAGQRYGTFNPDGSSMAGPPARNGKIGVATPYSAMIFVRDCSGRVEISGLELDGNLAAHVLGGKHGDRGWQIICCGIMLRNNKGEEILSNIYSHHHAQDGFNIDGPDTPTPGVKRRITELHSDANGRQGMSVTGGRDYEFRNCSFTRTGRGKIASAPAAGVDIEAENHKSIRNLKFIDCRFADNDGCGLVADSGDSADVSFTRCSFIGTTNWCAWPRKPGFRFTQCTFVGPLVRVFGDPDPKLAGQFYRCVFSDDPKLSPTGSLTPRKNVCADLSHSQNALFDHCAFVMQHDGVLPWSVGAIWQDCVMSQKSSQLAHTRGTFRGINTITGPVSISGSVIEGTLVLNGKRVTG